MSESLAVTATINLRGLRAGQRALVDPRDPYIAELLSASFLIADDVVAAGEEWAPPIEQVVDPPELPEAETTLVGLEDDPLGDADVLSLDSA